MAGGSVYLSLSIYLGSGRQVDGRDGDGEGRRLRPREQLEEPEITEAREDGTSQPSEQPSVRDSGIHHL